jgi:hypothetical protein
LHDRDIKNMSKFVTKQKYLNMYIYSPKKETQHVKEYNLLQIFNIILNTEISIALQQMR